MHFIQRIDHLFMNRLFVQYGGHPFDTEYGIGRFLSQANPYVDMGIYKSRKSTRKVFNAVSRPIDIINFSVYQIIKTLFTENL